MTLKTLQMMMRSCDNVIKYTFDTRYLLYTTYLKYTTPLRNGCPEAAPPRRQLSGHGAAY